MAGGRAFGRFEAALGVVGVLALATTYVLITGWNPTPALLDFLDRVGNLSEPGPAWAVRLGSRPDYAVQANRTIVVMTRGNVDVRDLGSGDRLWTRDVEWAAVAGIDNNAVVVTGRQNRDGFEVSDPQTGAIRWADEEAVGVWTYRTVVLSMTCKGVEDCTLVARDPTGGTERWRTRVPGIGKTLAGVNHELLGSRTLAASTMDGRVGSPVDAPPMLGFPVSGKVQVVDVETGQRVQEAQSGGTTRVVVVAGRVLYSKAERREGQCRYTLDARDAANGTAVWHKEGYDLRTASGAGCEQRRDPAGGGGTLATIRGDNKEALLDAYDGRELWVGQPGEHVLATDGLVALIRAADGKTIRGLDLGGGATLWERPVSGNTEATLTRYAAILVDGETGQVTAVEPTSGRLLVNAKTPGKVVGAGADGLIIAAGRNVGLLTYGTGAG